MELSKSVHLTSFMLLFVFFGIVGRVLSQLAGCVASSFRGVERRSRAYSSVGLERSPDKGKVSGSNPLRPTILMLNYVVCKVNLTGGCSSTGRALPLQGRG